MIIRKGIIVGIVKRHLTIIIIGMLVGIVR